MSEEEKAEAQDNTEEPTLEEKPAAEPKAEEAKAEEPKVEKKEEAKEEAKSKDEGLLAKAKEKAAEAVPEEYDIKLEEDAQWDDESLKDFTDIAKADGLTQDEAQKAAIATSKMLSKLIADSNAEQAKWQEDNAKEWDGLDPDGTKAIKAVEALEQSGLKDHFVERGYVHDAKLMSLIAEHGMMKSEAKAITGGDAPSVQAGRTYTHASSADLYEK